MGEWEDRRLPVLVEDRAELERAASVDNNLAPEKQERLLANIRSIVTRVRPFASEIAPLFSSLRGPDNPSTAQSCK